MSKVKDMSKVKIELSIFDALEVYANIKASYDKYKEDLERKVGLGIGTIEEAREDLEIAYKNMCRVLDSIEDALKG